MSLEAMKQALETLERLDRWLALRYGNELTPPEREVVKALRQAIEQAEKQETLILDRGCYERGCVAYDEHDGDAVNIKQERVDETAKRKHEPVAWLTEERYAQIHTAKREWVGLTDEDMEVLFLNEDGVRFAKYIEAKLKEKNSG